MKKSEEKSTASTAATGSDTTKPISPTPRNPAAVTDTRPNRADVPLATRAEVDELRKDMARILQLLEPQANGNSVPNGAANPAVGAGAQQWPTGSNPPSNQPAQGAGLGANGLAQLAQAKQLMESLDGQPGGQVDANMLLYRIMDSHLKLTDGITQMVIGAKLQQALTPPPVTK